MDFLKTILKVEYILNKNQWLFIVDEKYDKNLHDCLYKYILNKGYQNFRLIYIKENNVLIEFLFERIPTLKKYIQDLVINDNRLSINTTSASSIKILKEKGIDSIVNKLIGKKYTIEFNVLKTHDNMYKEELEKEFVSKALKENKEKYSLIDTVILGTGQKGKPIEISSILEEEKDVTVIGEVLDLNLRTFNSGRSLIAFYITDYTGSIMVKYFCNDETTFKRFNDSISDGTWLCIKGSVQFDTHVNELCILPKDISLTPKNQRNDNATQKRIELHCHTQYSTLDAVSNIKGIIERAAQWGHKAIAITDHGVLQGFPEAYHLGKKNNIKIIYGVEGYFYNDTFSPVFNGNNTLLSGLEFVSIDIETTGLSPLNHEIIEISAVKFKDNTIVETFTKLIKPDTNIPENITEITGIDNQMVANCSKIEVVLPEFFNFIGDLPIAAHNLPFDIGFIKAKWKEQVKNPMIDTLELSKALLPNRKSYKLESLCNDLKIENNKHHRAENDAVACGKLLTKLIEICNDKGLETINQLAEIESGSKVENSKTFHIIIIAKNQKGLKNLYKIVSESHLNYYYRNPRIPKSLLLKYREGLIIGSACEAGELFSYAIKGASKEDLIKIAEFYDFLEIQPLGNNEFLIRNGVVKDFNDIIEINKKIIEIGNILNKPVVATGDVHYIDPHDKIYRSILMAGQGYNDYDEQPPLYFKTTNEMLEDFNYLDEQVAHKIVVENPEAINNLIEEICPIKLELNTPTIEDSDQTIREMAVNKCANLYGNNLPKLIEKRLNHEINSIIGNGFSVIYLIAHKLVKKSLDDGYLVGSRGSVGSSFVAYLCDITEVNPLPPHYRCPQCKYSDFNIDISVYQTGPDLPSKNCPVCHCPLSKEGFNIPFEVFMGFEGNKVPDIDLNFSGEYQPIAHKYAEEILGKEYVYRAGTISTIAEKTAFGFVKNYCECKGLKLNNGEINRLVKGITGIKRTTGQHPGGLMVIPNYGEVYDFTPIQHPADDKKSGIITTHFDYHSLHDCLLKLDILGHDDPTVLKFLEEITGIDVRSIPLDDPDTMSIFSSIDKLNLKENPLSFTIGSLAIPEFGTRFVRQMLEQTRPSSFSELVRISGLSHGTDVWLNNANDLIKNKTATLQEVIATRDDIMTYLIEKGLDPKVAFNIMEKVRKGQGLTPEHEREMLKNSIDQWYIESCKKIKYMFPKAHAVAYVIMAFRIAFFKIHYPLAFYAAYFTVRADDFDGELILKGKEAILNKIAEIDKKGNLASQKEKNLSTILEVCIEMISRGFKFERIDIYKSHPHQFTLTSNGLIPPLNSLQGLGKNAAISIYNARKKGKFISIEDLQKRAKLSKTVIEILERNNCLDDLPPSNQITLFNLA